MIVLPDPISELVLRAPFDAHLHLREDEMLDLVLPHSAKQFSCATVMPNTKRLILTADDALWYRDEILRRTDGADFVPRMTLYITPNTTPQMIKDAKNAGIDEAKLFVKGISTGASHGVSYSEMRGLYKTFWQMQELNMVCLKHVEHPNSDWIDAEKDALKLECDFARFYPKLRVVIEHISSQFAVTVVRERLPETYAATITPHHLLLTMNDVDGRKIRPHNFCLPHVKRKSDREALLKIATSGNPRFFLGTDSAPHAFDAKVCAEGCAGIFNAPVALPLLAEIFEQRGRLKRLQAFISDFGAAFYGINPGSKTVTLRKKPWTVPAQYGNVVPLCAGRQLAWSLAA